MNDSADDSTNWTFKIKPGIEMEKCENQDLIGNNVILQDLI